MIIMFIIAATTSVGAVATLYMASSYCIDACCRLRMDRISKRDKANAWNARLGRKIAQVRLTWACVLSSTHLSKSLAAALRQCEPQPCVSGNADALKSTMEMSAGSILSARSCLNAQYHGG